MNKNTIIPLVAFIAFALAILALVPPTPKMQQAASDTSPLVYEGVTVCADCPGIETRLLLTPNTPSSAEGTYQLSLTYIDRETNGPYVESGIWTTERGTQTDPDATVYALYRDNEGVPTRYRVVNATTIRQLDGDGNEIDASVPFDLTLVSKPQAIFPEPRTVTGVRVCLPHKDTTVPQTKECALGLTGDDGLLYALDLANVPAEESSVLDAGRVQVTGVYVPIEIRSSDQWMRYDIDGILSVESISAL